MSMNWRNKHRSNSGVAKIKRLVRNWHGIHIEAGNYYVIYGLESRKRCWNDMICASTKGMATTETFVHLLNQKYMHSDAIKMLGRLDDKNLEKSLKWF